MNAKQIKVGDTVQVIGHACYTNEHAGRVGNVTSKGRYVVVSFGVIDIGGVKLKDEASFARRDLLVVG